MLEGLGVVNQGRSDTQAIKHLSAGLTDLRGPNLSVCLPVSMSVCLPVSVSVCLPVSVSVCLNFYLSTCLNVCIFFCRPAWLQVYRIYPKCLSRWLQVCLYVSLCTYVNMNVSVNILYEPKGVFSRSYFGLLYDFSWIFPVYIFINVYFSQHLKMYTHIS